MKNPPEWLRAALADCGSQVLAGKLTQALAAERLADEILARPEFVDEMAGRLGNAELAGWLKANRSCGDLLQIAMFPTIPAAMQVSVGTYKPVADMTAADLDNARAMLVNRTRNARTAADRQEQDFEEFFGKVRPLLGGGKTVGDVLPGIAAEASAA